MAQRASVHDILKDFNIYRVASQISPDKEVRVQTVRERDMHTLLEFLRRILNVGDLELLSFLEIHQIMPDGAVLLIREAVTPWPKHAKVNQVQGIIAPKIPRPVQSDTARKVIKEFEEQITQAREVLPPTIINHEAINKGPATQTDKRSDELGLPVFKYKMEVA